MCIGASYLESHTPHFQAVFPLSCVSECRLVAVDCDTCPKPQCQCTSSSDKGWNSRQPCDTQRFGLWLLEVSRRLHWWVLLFCGWSACHCHTCDIYVCTYTYSCIEVSGRDQSLLYDKQVSVCTCSLQALCCVSGADASSRNKSPVTMYAQASCD
jgi:hypothetical protein